MPPVSSQLRTTRPSRHKPKMNRRLTPATVEELAVNQAFARLRTGAVSPSRSPSGKWRRTRATATSEAPRHSYGLESTRRSAETVRDGRDLVSA